MSEWISVEDALPDVAKTTAKVLVNVNAYGVHIDHYLKTGRFYEYGDSVTHWMPLPEQPNAD